MIVLILRNAAALLPLAAWAALVLWMETRRRRLDPGGTGWRASFLGASVCVGLFAALTAGGLGALRMLEARNVTVLWIAFTVVAGLGWWRARALSGVRFDPTLRRLEPFQLVCGLGLLSFAAVLLVIALVSPPNHVDTVSYHLSRVMHWIQNRSLDHYPCHDKRQLYHPLLSEVGMLHLHLLAGSDRLAACVGWTATVGAAVGASSIAKHLGAGGRGQLLTTVLVMTLPMGILSATGGKNDPVLAFFLVALVVFLFRYRARPGAGDLLLAAFALALALYTKTTAYLYALPFLAWFGLGVLRAEGRRGWRRTAGVAATLIAVPLAVNGPLYARNLALFGHPLSEDEHRQMLAMDTHAPGAILSNLVRNATLHLGTRDPAWSERVQDAAIAIHARLGLDIEDLRTTHSERSGFVVDTLRYKDTSDGNPAHFVLALLALLVLPVVRRRVYAGRALAHAGALGAAVLLFCTFLKWQTGHSRFHLPLFVLAMAFAGAVWGAVPFRPVSWAIALAALVLASPWLVHNSTRSLVGREGILALPRDDLYFRSDKLLQLPIVHAVRHMQRHGATSVGWFPHSQGSEREYVLWTTLASHGIDARVEHVDVRNQSARLADDPPFADFVPDAVVSVLRKWRKPEAQAGGEGREIPFDATMEVRGRTYDFTWSEDRVALYYPRSGGGDG